MAKAWEELEERCYEYLKRIYKQPPSFDAYGKSDSTKADIKVQVDEETEFFIEVKASNSQCCQFVLFPNKTTQQFDFSQGNKAPCSDNCKRIIAYMNSLYKKYHRVGKKGIPIDIDKSVLYGLVTDFYSLKNVQFFMTQATDYIIFPKERFSEYFDICGFYRKKRSGSSEPNEKNNNDEILNGLREYKITGSIEYISFDKKTRCFFHSDEELHTKKIVCENYTYLFKDNSYSKKISHKAKNVYEIRRLSNTSNPNVICQLELKKDHQDASDLISFESTLKNTEE